MSKRRVASILVTGKKNSFKYPVKIVPVLSGTGTATGGGVFTLAAAATSTLNMSVYCTLTTGTNMGTLIGTSKTIV